MKKLKKIERPKSIIIGEVTHNRLKAYCSDENYFVGALVEHLINREIDQYENKKLNNPNV